MVTGSGGRGAAVAVCQRMLMGFALSAQPLPGLGAPGQEEAQGAVPGQLRASNPLSALTRLEIPPSFD